MEFGNYFGHNWDAFNECFRDFVEDTPRAVVIWTACDRLLKKSNREFRLLLEILSGTGEPLRNPVTSILLVVPKRLPAFAERVRQSQVPGIRFTTNTADADLEYRTLMARFNNWVNDRFRGSSAASQISDPLLRNEIEVECSRRVNRRRVRRGLSILCYMTIIAGATWLGKYFGLVGIGAPFFRRLPGVILLGLSIAILSTIVELLLHRFFQRGYERELWKIMRERGIPICQHCGYSLAGSSEPRCPECGTATDRGQK